MIQAALGSSGAWGRRRYIYALKNGRLPGITCSRLQITAVLVRQLISDVHWLARTERVSLRATPQLGDELIRVCAAAAKRSFEASFFDYLRSRTG